MDKFIKYILDNLHTNIEYDEKYSKVYKIHKYWARKPWYVVNDYIKKYSKESDLVVDPFCGSGCTGLEAISLNRNFIGYDLNPSAIAVTNATLKNDINIDELEANFLKIRDNIKESIMDLYKVEEKCCKCGKNMYIKYSLIGPKYKDNEEVVLYCPTCSSKAQIKRPMKKQEKKKINEAYDFKDLWYPDISFPIKFYKDRFSYKGITKVSDMYTKRNLYSLALLYNGIQKIDEKYRDLIFIAFSNTVLHSSKLKSENVRPLGVNNYWIPDDYIEENVWFRFEERFYNVLESKKILFDKVDDKSTFGKYLIKQKSALKMDEKDKVDYIFTDPPYGDAIQYSELSYIWNAWFNKEYDIKEEIIINPVQNKNAEEFDLLLFKSIDNIYDSLKQNKFFTLCFQNKNFEIWEDIINYCKNKGLVLENIGIYDTFGSSYNKNWAKFSPKADIYVTFSKKKKITKKNFFEKNIEIHDIIKEILQYFNETTMEFDNIKLYDVFVAYLIWNIYYNKHEINIKKMDTKKFCKIAEEVQKELEIKRNDEKEYKQISFFDININSK